MMDICWVVKWLALCSGLVLARVHGQKDGQVVRPKGACGSIDVRNTVESFKKLENCTVIEGHLKILLIDYAKPEEFEPLSFPDLVEITDYFLLYRVYGLRSLRNIFPNLAVIRGHRLFNNYALIVFELPFLEELGLISLTSILRGAVRLEKNSNLCYIETIDWMKIVTGVSSEANFFKANKDVKECVNRCPSNQCSMTMEGNKPVERCWTLHNCQKMLDCPSHCKFCNGRECCDPHCIGGCTGRSSSDCLVCKDVIQHKVDGKQVCADRCNPGTYKFRNRRCLLEQQCTNFSAHFYPINVQGGLKLWDPVDSQSSNNQSTTVQKAGECVAECPSLYKVDPNNSNRCKMCQGKCPRFCTAKVIDSVSSAEDLKDCTVITGPLEINIMGGNHVGTELEKSLSQIEEVWSYIRIYHSYALLSLHFLKNLKFIKGQQLYQKHYSLVVFDNLNLQELFLEETAKNLKLGNGTVLIQYNRKLCINKIDSFIQAIGDPDKKHEKGVSKETNGDQTPCEIEHLEFVAHTVTPHIAILKWQNFVITDQRHLISYTINYKEAPVKNVSIYDGRDACSSDAWKVVEVEPKMDNESKMLHFLTPLKPWTQYAAYVQTLMISNAKKGAMSNIIYFRTDPSSPTSPTNLKVRAEKKRELKVTWDPPSKPNGNVTHYIVFWKYRALEPEQYELRDYCDIPLQSSRDNDRTDTVEEKNVTRAANCCVCPKSAEELQAEKRERNLEIQFQDFLQNAVYVKRLRDSVSTAEPKRVSYMTFAANASAFNMTVPIPRAPDVTKYAYHSPTLSAPLDKNLSVASVVNSKGSGIKKPTGPITPAPPTPPGGQENTTMSPNLTSKVLKMKSEQPYQSAVVYEKREAIIPNLGHFLDYNIEVIACQERHAEKEVLCSNRAIGLGRTLPSETADTINASSIQVLPVKNNTNAVRIEWEDPKQPNGLIITYEIEYKKSNVNNIKALKICIPYKKYRTTGNKGHRLENLDSGNYTFRLRATSLAGNGSWTDYHSFFIEAPPVERIRHETMIAIVVSVIIVIVLITIAVVWFVAKNRFRKKHPENVNTSANPNYATEFGVYEPDEWEVDRENVSLMRELGQGSFGMVYEGRVKNLLPGEEVKVAVKTTNNNSSDYDRYNFLQEASTMKAFRCHHVVQLMGVVSRGQPAYVLMELMDSGDLKNYLRMHRPDEEDNNGATPPTLKQIWQIAGEIADGMAYLADKKYVHRDLAARNCMVAGDLTVKIGDFGMTRDIYETDYYRKGNRGLLPVRWMAPESLKDGLFTSMSDVWSYGVVLWEMATLAAQPYQGLSNEEVLRYVGSGRIMDTPDGCPAELFELMVKCWRYRHKQRPTFKEIIEGLLPNLDKKFQEVSYFFSEENAKFEEAKNHSHEANPIFDEIDHDSDENDNPMNDYVDESHMPFLEASGTSNDQGVELEDIFTDSGGYPWAPKTVGSEMCDCTLLKEVDEGAAAQSADFNHRESVCSNPNSAIGGGSSDGSKGSSKSSSSSYAHINGLSVANGHVPVHVRTTPC